MEESARDRIMPDKKVHVYNIVWFDDFMSLWGKPLGFLIFFWIEEA